MNYKKIALPLMALVLAFTIVSCGGEKNEKATLPVGEIALDRLPAAVKDLVTKDHPGYVMVKAVSDPLCQGGDAIDVAIVKTGAPNLSLIFKSDGTYVQQEEDVPLTTASSKIIDALKAKYSDYSASTQIERLILADNSVQYLVDLSKGNVTKEVIFTTDGNVVCEK